MSISITSNSITISDETVFFDDIYQYAVDNNQTDYIKKLGNSYNITVNIYIKDNGCIKDTNKFITVEGELFQIEKGSSLRLGTKRDNGSTIDGCTLNIPNVKLAYGFGNTTKDNSGDLFLYGSTINAYGFWGFFEGTNHVEIIDCFIDGFGRISGEHSIAKNIIFKQANGRYGTITALGEISEMHDIRVYAVKDYQGNKCSIYHNPILTGDLTVYYGEYGGYEKLAYLEKEGGEAVLELRGTKVLGTYDLYREGTNVDFYHSFRYSGKILSPTGSSIAAARIVVKDKNGEVVHDVLSEQNGNVDLWIKYYEDKAGSDAQVLTPHTFEITKDDISIKTLLYLDKNYEDLPIYLIEGGGTSDASVDYDRIQAMVTQNKEDVCACSKNENEIVQDKLSKIISDMSATVTKEINENERIIKETSSFSIII